jgi:hypothetical protein
MDITSVDHHVYSRHDRQQSRLLSHQLTKADIRIDWQLREKFWDWCQDANIHIEYQGTLQVAALTHRTRAEWDDVWRIENDAQRTWAILRWQ